MEILSFADVEEIDRIKLLRNGLQSPKLLKNLALENISDNAIHLINAPEMEKVFSKLPPPLAFEVINKIQEEKDYFLKDNQNAIFRLFYNEYTTEVMPSTEYDEEKLITHLGSHCPHLKSYKVCPDTLQCNALPTLKLMLNWHNLQVLVLEGCQLNDEGAGVLRQNLPNLKELEVAFSEDFTMVGVEHFASMEHLGCLHVGWVHIVDRNLEAATMAGTMKKLHTFNYKNSAEVYRHDEFLLLLRVLYPEKELKMDFIQLRRAPFVWAPKLQVKTAELHIGHRLSDEFFKQVSEIRCDDISLYFSENVNVETIYNLCTDFGPRVKCVDIGRLTFIHTLDLSRVFTACPNLAKFQFHSDVYLTYPFSCEIGPQHFSNCEHFSTVSQDPAMLTLQRRNAAVANRLLRLYVLGSKTPFLFLKTDDEVQTVEGAMLDSPLALSNIEGIRIAVAHPGTRASLAVKKLLEKMVKRCFKLKRIEILHGLQIEVIGREFSHLARFFELLGIGFRIYSLQVN